MVVKVHLKYVDAFHADLKKIAGEVEKLEAAVKKNPKDAASQKKLDQIKPHLTEAALKRRLDSAIAQDAKSLDSMFKKEFGW